MSGVRIEPAYERRRRKKEEFLTEGMFGSKHQPKQICIIFLIILVHSTDKSFQFVYVFVSLCFG